VSCALIFQKIECNKRLLYNPNLDPMTSILDLDLDLLKMNLYTENKVRRIVCHKVNTLKS